MSTPNQTPPPAWTEAMTPARAREDHRGRDPEAMPPTLPAVEAASLAELAGEVRALRASFDSRLRGLQHRLDAIDTDLLRVVNLIRDESARREH